jgi:pathogenesis-related protein 1
MSRGNVVALFGLTLCLGASAVWADDPKVWVNAHNAYRSKHCVPLLTWSAQLAASAQEWANGCKPDPKNPARFAHSDVPGENLFSGTAGSYSPELATSVWYGEIKDYNFAAPGFANNTGHFTQVVWRDSKQVGCGKAQCGDKDYWVCRYSPPGNVQGQFPANVQPASCEYRIESVPKPPPGLDPRQHPLIESVPKPRGGTGNFLDKMKP